MRTAQERGRNNIQELGSYSAAVHFVAVSQQQLPEPLIIMLIIIIITFEIWHLIFSTISTPKLSTVFCGGFKAVT